MGTTIERAFSSREKAELVVEHLVQEHGFERTDIFVVAAGDNNSAGETDTSGAANNGPISVSVDLDKGEKVALVKAVFDEFEND